MHENITNVLRNIVCYIDRQLRHVARLASRNVKSKIVAKRNLLPYIIILELYCDVT